MIVHRDCLCSSSRFSRLFPQRSPLPGASSNTSILVLVSCLHPGHRNPMSRRNVTLLPGSSSLLHFPFDSPLPSGHFLQIKHFLFAIELKPCSCFTHLLFKCPVTMSIDQLPHLLCGLMLYYLNIMLYASSDNYLFLEAERLLYEVNRPNASVFSVLGRPILNEIVQFFVSPIALSQASIDSYIV